MRGWTWIDEDSVDSCDCDENDSTNPGDSCEKCAEDSYETIKRKMKLQMIEKLAGEWNDVHRRIEERGWRCRDDRDAENDYHSEMADEWGYEEVSKAEEAIEKRRANGEVVADLTKKEENDLRQKGEDAYYAMVDKREQEIFIKRDALEELLRDLGVRMMRPYEHWNEDERYMEYMETRYDSYDDDY